MVQDVTYEPLWSTKKLQEYLGVSRPTVTRLVHKYGLPYLQIGENTSRMYFRPEEVYKWVILHEIPHKET